MAEQLRQPVKDEQLLYERAHDSIRGRSLREMEEEDRRLTGWKALSPEEQAEITRRHSNEMRKDIH